MEGISGGLGSVDAAVTPRELSQKMFGRVRGIPISRCVDKSKALCIWDVGLSSYLQTDCWSV